MLRKRMARAELPNSKKLLNLPPKILPTGQNLREIYESRRNRLLLMSWVWFCNIWSFLSSSFVTNCGSSIAFSGERSCAKCPRMTKTYKNSVTLLRLPFSSNSDITHARPSSRALKVSMKPPKNFATRHFSWEKLRRSFFGRFGGCWFWFWYQLRPEKSKWRVM